MRQTYKKYLKIKYNNQLFQVVIRKDNSYGFFKIVNYQDEEKLVIPTAQEFLHLSSVLHPHNRIKF